MLPESMVKARLSLEPGTYVREPNIVLVPGHREKFPVRVAIEMESRETYVVGVQERQHVHQWCVLNADLKQVMVGEVRHGRPVGKSVEAAVTRSVMGGGAPNPDDFDIELAAAKLKNGATYTLVCSVYGILAALQFVALGEPRTKPKAAAKKKSARPAKPAAAAKKKSRKKTTAKKGKKRKKRAA